DRDRELVGDVQERQQVVAGVVVVVHERGVVIDTDQATVVDVRYGSQRVVGERRPTGVEDQRRLVLVGTGGVRTRVQTECCPPTAGDRVDVGRTERRPRGLEEHRRVVRAAGDDED